MKKIINTDLAPQAIGPYSQATEVSTNGHTLYVSGQIPLVPSTGEFISNDVTEQTKQVLENAKAILTSCGYTLDDVVKTTVLLSSMDDFSKMNDVYATYFTKHFPARAAYEVARLPLDAKVEIEMIASK